MNRADCVRRAYLCAEDTVSGKGFEHRRQWIQDRMQFLAGQFGINVLGFAVLGITRFRSLRRGARGTVLVSG